MKLPEYKALPSVDTIILVDIVTERLRIVQRTGPDDWAEHQAHQPIDVALPSFGVAIPHHEAFARD